MHRMDVMKQVADDIERANREAVVFLRKQLPEKIDRISCRTIVQDAYSLAIDNILKAKATAVNMLPR